MSTPTNVTSTGGIDLGVITMSSDFVPRVKSWDKFPLVLVEILDEYGEWRTVYMRPYAAKALAKGLNKMARLVEDLDA